MGPVSVAGLLLAAGAGRRYGMPKALVRHGDRLLVERAIRTLADGGCAPVVVVLGAASDEVRRRADLSGVTVVVNREWATGMGSSLRAGLAALAATGVGATVVLLVDTPGVTPAAVRRLAALAGDEVPPGGGVPGGGGVGDRAAGAALAVATYRGEPGHPVLLGRRHWAGAAESAVGDVGARGYLRRHRVTEVPCDDVADGTDLDRPPD